jgi:hypothetical protein
MKLSSTFFACLLAACSSSNSGTSTTRHGAGTSTSTTTGSTATSTGAGGSSSSSSASSGTGGAGGTGFTPPTIPAACTTPTTASGAEWKAASGEHFWGLRAAWGGKEAAIAYAESTGSTGWAIKLQRLTEAGAASGAVVSLGVSLAMATAGPVVGLATDGNRYMACWDQANTGSDVACAVVPVGMGGATPGFSGPGDSPTIAVGTAGWALAYGSNGKIVAQALGNDGKASGASVNVGAQQPPSPNIVATTAGFAVVGGGYTLYRLDAMLHSVGSAVPVGSGSSPLGVAAAGDTVGVAWADSMQDSFVAIAANTPSTTVAADDGMGGTYSHVAAAAGKSTFAVVWSDVGGTIGYRAVDATGTLLGSVQHVMMTAWDDNPVAVTGVGDGFLVIAATSPSVDDMIVTHLACP